MPHVKEHLGSNASIKLHKCPKEEWYKKWSKLLNRDNYEVNKNTRVCSNHFEYGQPRELAPHPKLHMKGYEITTPRRLLMRNTEVHSKPVASKSRKKLSELVDSENVSLTTNICTDSSTCNISDDIIDENEISKESLSAEIQFLKIQLAEKDHQLSSAKEKIKDLEKKNSFGIISIKHSDNLIRLHTGLASYSLFCWLLDEVSVPASNMKYYKGEDSHETTSYQENNAKKPGPKRKLSLEDELLMTLMKLRLNLNQEFMASLFNVSSSLVSSIITTWISLLALELRPLIHWPTRDQLDQYYPDCYSKYGKVTAIIDCTEVQTERPSLDSTNSALYSNYKSRHTYKVLVACTPGGTVSFVSHATGGDMSDVELVRRCGILDLFEEGDKVMADKGFNNKDDFLLGDVELIIPAFARKNIQFRESKNISNTEISNARIHVERVIGRMKDFKILQGPIPLILSDVVDNIVFVCGCLVNLSGVLVPLHTNNKSE
ncbi:uncharacterized protein [Mytilus edulis]|uniref:THAP-type domain-containing protein n=2 Tax=Mytilus edulis TaxID=6550 RepID=A0A8S3UGX1_MYTED|nr:unnamed protein product [Mytilus edulis]